MRHWMTDEEIKQVAWWPEEILCDECANEFATRLMDANEAGIFAYCDEHGTTDEGAGDE